MLNIINHICMKGKKRSKHLKKTSKPLVKAKSHKDLKALAPYLLFLLIVFVFISYAQIRHHEFIHYDDNSYIGHNEDIRELSLKNIQKIFINPDKPEDLKPPLTVVSFAVNYAIGGLNPAGYYTGNLLLHILNILLVYLLVLKISNNRVASLFVCTVFAFHPSLTEAVAWASARKEVLYTFFYLGAILMVIKFWEKRQALIYISAIGLFVLSYYSKFSAATFPLLYLALAFLWKGRKDWKKVLLESTPFFLLPLYTFYRAVFPDAPHFFSYGEASFEYLYFFKEEIKIVPIYADFGLIDKIFMGGYSFVVYLLKFLFPFQQQLIYPYPEFTEAGFLPLKYYLFTAVALAVFIYTVIYFIRHPGFLKKPLGFGIIFFLVNVTILLHILPIGGRVIVADRYSYLPFIGLGITMYYIVVALTEQNILKTAQAKYLAYLFILLLVIFTHIRIPDWRNTETIFKDLVAKEASYPIAYNTLGVYYTEINRPQEAIKFYSKAIDLVPHFSKAINNRGTLYMFINENEKAKSDFYKYLEFMPDEATPYHNLGNIYEAMGLFDEAIKYYKKAVAIKPDYYTAWYNQALLYYLKEDFENAKLAAQNTIEYKPDFAPAHNIMGSLSNILYQDTTKAIMYFQNAIDIDPFNVQAQINISNIFLNLKEYEKALHSFTFIIDNLNRKEAGFLGRGIALFNMGRYEEACVDFEQASQYGSQEARHYLINYCSRIK